MVGMTESTAKARQPVIELVTADVKIFQEQRLDLPYSDTL